MANQHKELAETVRKTLLHSQHSVAMVDGAPSFFDPALQALDSLVEQFDALRAAVQKELDYMDGFPDVEDGSPLALVIKSLRLALSNPAKEPS